MSASASSSMFWLNRAIHPVPSACSSRPPVGNAALRSKTPMLSSPRNPPSNTFLPAGSLRLTHHVKLSSRRVNDCRRNGRSTSPRCPDTLYMNSVAKACTGGLTSPKFHS